MTNLSSTGNLRRGQPCVAFPERKPASIDAGRRGA
jgi:hypothetical protein